MGPHKTGTTSIQNFLIEHRSNLSQDGYDATRILGDRFHPTLKDFREIRRCIKGGSHNCRSLSRHWNQSLASFQGDPHILISDEEFAHFDFEHNPYWHSFRTTLQQQFQVRAVLVYRRYYEWLASYYNQHFKFHGPYGHAILTWPSFDPAKRPRRKAKRPKQKYGVAIPSFVEYWYQRLNNSVAEDPFILHNQWDHLQQRPCHDIGPIKRKLETQGVTVTLINYHQDKNIIPQFVCDAIPNARTTCDTAKTEQPKQRNLSSNNHDYDRIACEAKRLGFIPDDKRLERRTVIGAVKEFMLQQGNWTLQQLPQTCIGEKELKILYDISYEAERQIMPSALPTFDDDFAKAKANGKFCSVNVEAVLNDPIWRSFFSSLPESTTINHKK
jgi:hypothetical protein